MHRATPLAFCVAMTLLAGCGPNATQPQLAANTAGAENDDMEALPSDGLAAPEGMPIDSESNMGAAADGGPDARVSGNGGDNGGNAM